MRQDFWDLELGLGLESFNLLGPGATFFPRFIGGLTKKYGDKVAWRMGVSRDLYPDTKAGPRHNIKHYSAFITYPHLEFMSFNLEIGTMQRSNSEGI